MPTISFSSIPQFLVLPPDAEPYTGEIDGLRIREIAETGEAGGMPDGVVQYSIRIEAEVGTLRDVYAARERANALIEDLERVWQYAAGLPLRPVRTYLEVQYAPDGWTSNAEEVEEIRALEQGLTATMRIISRHWLHAPCWPLRPALRALAAFRDAGHIVRTLIELHLDAQRSTRQEGRLFFFAKALELVRELIPGRDLRAKSANVHTEVQGLLSQPLSWLYDMSNNRADIRHVVRNPKGPELHPQMTPTELRDYEHNADLVIRGVVARHLGIELAVVLPRPLTAS